MSESLCGTAGVGCVSTGSTVVVTFGMSGVPSAAAGSTGGGILCGALALIGSASL